MITHRHNFEHNSIACVREEVLRPVTDGSNSVTSTNMNRSPLVFRTLSGTETLHEQGRHLIRVPTIAAILNRRWFIEQIENILKIQSEH